MEVTRERAWQTLTQYTKSEALRRHALAVEAAVGWYAREFDEDEEFWRATALLHDFDYEIHPTLRSSARRAIQRSSSRPFSRTRST